MADYNSSYTGIQIDTAVGKALSPDTTVAAGSSSLITSGAVASALAVKAPLASPSFTGTPTAPTATAGTNTTQLANTAFVQAAVSGLAPISHASSATTYGKGTNNYYGHVKLSNAIDSSSSTSDGVAATPSAVKAAYDLANGKAPISHASSATTYGKGTNSRYGHVQLSDAIDSSSSASDGVAATPAAVKAAYDLSESAYDVASSKAPTSHASSATTYGKGTNNYYGHVKLSNATNSSSSTGDGIAATPSAVKAAYDLANGKAPISHASSETTYGKATSSNYGHVKLSNAIDSSSSTSGGVAATPSAVKAAYDLADSKLLLISFANMAQDNTQANLLAALDANNDNIPLGASVVRIGSSNNPNKCLILCIKSMSTAGRGFSVSPYTDINKLNLYLSPNGWSSV